MQTTHTTQHEPFPLGQSRRLFLGGEWVDGRQSVEIRFPYDRDILVGRVAWADQRDVNAALEGVCQVVCVNTFSRTV